MEARSLIQFKDAPAIFNLTAEEEDKRYGCLKTYSEEAHKQLLRLCVFMSDEERKRYFRTPDFVWSGLDAAYIESKGVKPVNVVKISQVLGKRKLSESVSMLAEETKESLDNMEDDSEDDSEENPIKFRNEFAVAVLAYEVVLNFFDWPKFELNFGKDAHNLFMDRLFVAAVKLILSIFDEGDFERICYRFEIKDEHTSLYAELFAKNDYHKAVAQLRWKFSHLWESDIYDALHQFTHLCQLTQLEPLRLDYPIRVMDPSYVSKALELKKKYIPLKGNIKAQLLLEHAGLKCFHVTDTLVLQAFHSVDLPSLFGDCKENEEKCKLLSDLGDAMLRGFNSLSLNKARELVFEEECVTAPAMYQFGPCKLEVVDVIKLANHERRLANERFIRKEHILAVLSLSRVRDCLKEINVDSELCYQGESSSKLYTYELCRLSLHLAKEIHGVDGEWGLEHLVFSFLFGSSLENLEKSFHQRFDLFERLRLCKSEHLVHSWRNIDVFMILLEKRCRFGERYTCLGHEAVEKLHKELQSGNLQLPLDEDLRAI